MRIPTRADSTAIAARSASTGSSMNLVDWYWSLQGLAVGLLFVSFCLAALTLIASKRAAARDAERIIGLETELTRAKTALARQEERTAQAEATLIELETRFGWRSLSAETEEVMIERLAPFAGQAAYIWVFQKDAESLRLAKQLGAVLIKSGLSAQVLQTDLPKKPRMGGLQVDVGANRIELGRALIEILLTSRSVGKVTRGESQTADWVEIAIWAKSPDE